MRSVNADVTLCVSNAPHNAIQFLSSIPRAQSLVFGHGFLEF